MMALLAWLGFVLLLVLVVVWNVVADRAAKRAVEAGLRRDLGWQSIALRERTATLRRPKHGVVRR
jgi:hypothetical protein